MSPDVSASTVLLVGVMLVRITVTDVFQRYVKVSMGPFLLASGVVLTLLGLVMVVRSLRRAPSGDGQGDHDHRHLGGDRVGWLLLAPVLALLLVAPPALGSFGVDRTANVRVASGSAVFAPLDPSTGPHDLTLLEADQRAWDQNGRSFGTTAVRLTGFVADRPGDGPAGTLPGADDRLRLARYQIGCCAADAVASVVHVTGVTDLLGSLPARDTWATVTGTFAGIAPDGLPIVRATTVQIVPAPLDTYE